MSTGVDLVTGVEAYGRVPPNPEVLNLKPPCVELSIMYNTSLYFIYFIRIKSDIKV